MNIIIIGIIASFIIIPSCVFAQQTEQVPSWIKNNAGWWAEGNISDDDFLKSVQFLIEHKIIKLSVPTISAANSEEIPEWIKNNAEWWNKELISDKEFLKSIQFLVEQEIISIQQPSEEFTSTFFMEIREAFENPDKTQYNKIIQVKLRDIPKLDSNNLINNLDEIIEISKESGHQGFEPLLTNYINKLESMRDFEITRYAEAKKNLADVLILPNCDDLLVDRFRESGPEGIVPSIGGHTGAWTAACAPSEIVYREFNLVDHLITNPEEEGASDFVPIILHPPRDNLPLISDTSDIGFAATMIGEFPEGNLELVNDSANDQLGIISPLLVGADYDIAPWARSKTFTIQMSQCMNDQNQPISCFSQESANEIISDFDITIPVKLGIHPKVFGSLHRVLDPGDTVNILVYASGDEVDVSGQMKWSLDPPANTFPAGLSMQVTDNGNLRITGTVEEGTHSLEGILRLEQGENFVEKKTNFKVPVHFLQKDYQSITSQVHDLKAGDFLRVELPQAWGGDGTNYKWEIESNVSLFTDLGLQLIEEENKKWVIEGTIPQNIPLGKDTIVLRVSSPTIDPSGLRAATIPFNVNVYAPFTVWTQNTIERPEDIISDGIFVALTAASINPFTTAIGSPLLIAATTAEGFYDYSVQNTDEDNQERMYFIQNMIHNYDIIALQEMFDENFGFDYYLINGIFPNPYQIILGPSSSSWSLDLPPEGLPHSNSGLQLLIKNHFRILDFNDVEFPNCNGDFDDCLANKGFVIAKIQIGPDLDDYLFVLNTHLDSENDQDDKDVRDSQIRLIKSTMDSFTDLDHPVILMGDFNIIGDTQEYDNMIQLLSVNDLFREYFGHDHETSPGYTFDNQLNAYAHHWGDDNSIITQERLDYILVRQGNEYQIKLDTSYTTPIQIRGDDPIEGIITTLCKDSDLPLSGWLIDNRNLRCYVSDHFGLTANLRLEKP